MAHHDDRNGRNRRSSSSAGESGIARGLGILSIGLGLAGVFAPRRTARWIGAPDGSTTPKVLRGVGARELTAGAGLLRGRKTSPWLWSRVGGDLVDLALLGRSFSARSSDKGRLKATTAVIVGITAVDVLSARRVSSKESKQGILTSHAITVNQPVEEVYAFWHDFTNFPRFMAHVESVTQTGPGRTHWQARGPAGMSVVWDAEVTEDRPSEAIAWRSLDGADVDNSGAVHFRPAPGGRGTEVHVELRYSPPGGATGAAIASLFGENPAQQAQDDLRRFKQVMETGEVVRSEATPTGARISRMLKQRPARAEEKPSPAMEPAASR